MRFKFLIIFIAIFLIFPLISGASINLDSKYDQGETIIASISGNFLDVISKDNVRFYRRHISTAFDFDVIQMQNNYYIYIQTEDKNPNNYSVQIQGVRYTEGNKVYDDDIVKHFNITNNIADFSIEPGFIITDGDFFIYLRNLKNSNLDVDISNPISTINLNPFETKKVDFNLNVDKTTLRTIDLSSSNLNYEFLAYVIKSKKASNETNETKDPDEPDEEEQKGSECITNWNCIGSQTCENGFCVGGQESSEEENNETKGEEPEKNETIKGDECTTNWNCKAGEYCDNGYCLLKNQTEVECAKDSDCGDGGKICTSEGKCVNSSEIECTSKDDCNKNESCVNNSCIYNESLEKDFEEESEKDYEIVETSSGEIVAIKDGEIIKENATLKTCEELQGSVCSSSQICDGDSKYAKDNYCCVGSCVKKQEENNTKTIGWVLIGVVVLILVFLLFKLKNKKKKKVDFGKFKRRK